jgi:hypothetical protein
MSITNELREYTGNFYLFRYKDVREKLDAIADRIDAEHETQLNDAFETRNSDENLESDGWVRLPVDEDGDPIHMGDLVTVPWNDKVYEVAGFSCTKQLCSGIRTIWIDVYSPEKQRNVPLCGADSCRHYHAPTVEDVLREFADRVYNSGHQWGLDAADTIAEYAQRLRLAGDE